MVTKFSALLVSFFIVTNAHANVDNEFIHNLKSQSDSYQVSNDFKSQLEQWKNDERYDEYKQFGLNLINKQQAEQTQAFFSPVSNDIRYEILLSDSMGISKIRDILSEMAKTDLSVTFYIKGMLPDEHTITDAMRRSFHYVQGIDPVPELLLNPDKFEGTNLVPQLTMYKGNTELLTVKGVTNPYWLEEQFEAGYKGDLEVQGQTYPVVEISPTTIALERAEKLDNEKIIQQAKDNYWKKVAFVELPNAYKNQVRTFVPEILVTQDLVSQEGHLLLQAGQRTNLLEILPFTQTMIVFDGTDKRQIDFVKSLPVHNHSTTKLITTKLDRSKKWSAVRSLEDELNNQVFLLNTDIINGYNVLRVPSVITADNTNHHFNIAEYDVRDL